MSRDKGTGARPVKRRRETLEQRREREYRQTLMERARAIERLLATQRAQRAIAGAEYGRENARRSPAEAVKELRRQEVQAAGAPAPVGQFVANLLEDAARSAVGFPAGAVGAVRHPLRTAGNVAKSYRHQYGPLDAALPRSPLPWFDDEHERSRARYGGSRGALGEFGERFYEHPLGPLLDLGAVASLGAAGAVRATGRTVPRERRLGFEGGSVQPAASPNTLTRAVQHAADRFSERIPEAAIFGAKARVAKRLPFERQREHERTGTVAVPFQVAARRLSPGQRFAYDVTARYGDKAPERLGQEIAFRRDRLAKATTLAEKSAQRKQLLQLRAARKHVLNPSRRLQRAIEEGRALAARTEATKIAVGQLTPENARVRIDQPSRIVAGGELGQQTLRAADEPVAVRQVERPRTEAEARERLAQLETQYEDFIQRVEETLMAGGRFDPAETLRRNARRAGLSGRRRGRAIEGGAALPSPRSIKTQREELRELAEERLDELAAARPDDPSVRAFVQMRDELEALRASVTEAAEASLLGTEAPSSFGSITERVAEYAPEPELPTAGEGAFFMPDVSRSPIKSLAARKRSITGKPRKLVFKSEGVLFTQGRFRRGTKLTLEDFQKTSRYQSQLLDIDEAATFSKPLNPDSPNGLDGPGMRHFNPEGVMLPRRFRDEPPADEIIGMTPKEIAEELRGDYEELIANVFPKEAAVRNLSPAMQAKVRQIDKTIVRAFEGRNVRIPGYAEPVAKVIVGALDAVNNFARAGIYLTLKFVPLNFGSAVGFAAVQQGPWVLVNLAKAARILGDLKPETLRRIDLEVGSGGALALGGGGRGPGGTIVGALASGSNIIAERLPRRSAFVHEAANRGYKTDAELDRLLTDPELRPVLNQAAETAENAMVNFRNLSELERNALTRFGFVYPWVKGATVYTARLPFDRPLRADVIAHLGEDGAEETLRKLGEIASYLDGLIAVGDVTEKLGTKTVPVVSAESVTPFGTFADVAEASLSTARGESSGSRLFDFASPAVSTPVELGTGINTFTGRPYPREFDALDIIRENTLDATALGRLIEGLQSEAQTEPFTGPPSEQPVFIPGGPREAVLRFLGGSLAPRELNLPAAQARGREERRARMSPVERIAADYREDASSARKQAQVLGMKRPPPEVLADLKWRRDLDIALERARQEKERDLTPIEKAAIAARQLRGRYPETGAALDEAVEQVGGNDRAAQRLYERLRRSGTRSQSDFFRAAARLLEEAMVDLDELDELANVQVAR